MRKENTLFKKRNASISFALECGLLFLAIFIFSWGLHAKLALYHSDQGTSSATNSTAKLSAETRTARTAVSVERQTRPRFTLDSLHLSALAYTLQGCHATDVTMLQIELGPRIAGQYYLHGPDSKRRPPPTRS